LIGWGILVAALLGFIALTILWNIRFRREQRMLAVSRSALTEATFQTLLTARGVPVEVVAAVRDTLAGYYLDGITPHPDDSFDAVLHVDQEEIQDMVEQVWKALALPVPTKADPEQIPNLMTVGDLALYVGSRYRHFVGRLD
jgi:hypothetical protein